MSTVRPVKSLQDRAYQQLTGVGLGPADVVVAAVSGGPDSTVLLDLLVAAHPRGGPRIHVAHFNHMLRSNAAEVGGAVARRARDIGVPCTIGTVSDYPMLMAAGQSQETSARNARWAFLRAVARQCNARRIVTGHTRDDQVETVVMNLARGSGLRGLAGMRPDNGEILRPLLGTSRREVLDYVQVTATSVDNDPLNLTRDFRRNRIRHELVPMLNDIFPGASSAIARGADVVADELAHSSSILREVENVRMPLHPQRAAVPGGSFPDELVGAVRAFTNKPKQLGAAQLGAVVTALRTGTSGRWIELVAGIQAYVRHGAIALYPERTRDPAWSPAVPFCLPGVAKIPGGHVVADFVDRDSSFSHRHVSDVTGVDLSQLRNRLLTVRAPIPHERVRVDQGHEPRDLMNLLRGRGIASAIADAMPVVDVHGRAVCVPGVWRDPQFAPGSHTAALVTIKTYWDSMPEAKHA